MKRSQAYVCMGAAAVVLTAAILANHSVRDANAQQSTIQNQTDQDQTNRSTDTQTNQTQNQTRATAGRTTSADPNQKVWRSSEIIGTDVRGRTGDDEIGEISDVVVGPDGKVRYVAVSFGGFLGLGDKLFAVPWEAVQFVREGDEEDDIYARIDVTEEQLRTKRGFNEDNWPAEPDESFLPANGRGPRQVERTSPTTREPNQPRQQ